MKAPKLFLALGLSVPILVQGLSHHQHGHSDLADTVPGPPHNEHASAAQAVNSEVHLEARHFEHASDEDKRKTSARLTPIPFTRPPPSVEQRDTAYGNQARNGNPSKTHCNPFAPFCSNNAAKVDWSEEQGKVLENREFDTPEYFDAYHPQKRSNNLDHAASDVTDDSPFDYIDETLASSLVKCALLTEGCETYAESCACSLVQRCSKYGLSTTVTSLEMLTCLDRNATGFDKETDVDKKLRCMLAEKGCEGERGRGCFCRFRSQCTSKSGSGPTWKALSQCLYYDGTINGAGDSVHTYVAADGLSPRSGARPGSSIWVPFNMEKQTKCEMLRSACATGTKPCACNLHDQCSKTGEGSTAFTNRELNVCILGNGPLDQVNLDDDAQIRCFAASQECTDGRDCGCRLHKQCGKYSRSAPSWIALKSCRESKWVKGTDATDSSFKRDVEDVEEFEKACKKAEESCRQGSHCACHFSARCHDEGGLHGHDLEMMKQCLHAGWRNAPCDEPSQLDDDSSNHYNVPRDEPVDPILALAALKSEGGEATLTFPDGTLAFSVSQTSPYIMVETGVDTEGGFTLVNSLISSNSRLQKVTGMMYGKPVATTSSIRFPMPQYDDWERRDVQSPPTSTAHAAAPVAGDAFTETEQGVTFGGSIVATAPTVGVLTVGAEGEGATLVVSAIETSPPAMAVSGALADEILSATTMGLEALQGFFPALDLAGEYVEEGEYAPNHHRQAPPMPTPGFVTTSRYHVNGGPASAVFSVAATSPLVIVEKYYDGDNARTHTQTFPASISPPIATRDIGHNEEDFAKRDAASTSTTTVAVAGNNSTPYFKATDAEGRPIYVTRTGEYAASTKTLTFSESVPAATTTREGGIVEYRVITTTKTVYGGPRCIRTPMAADKTVASLGGTEVPITSSVQTVNGTVLHFVPAVPTLMPFWREAYFKGYEHLLHMDRYAAMQMYADHGIDWNSVDNMSWQLRKVNGELVPEMSFQKALVMHLRSMRGDPEPYASVTTLDRTNVKQYFPDPSNTQRVIFHNGTSHVMTGATQTIDNKVLVADPLAQFSSYDPRYHRVVPTPACLGNEKAYRLFSGWGKKECMVERCMWSHMKPLVIRTAFPAALHYEGCGQMYDYFTQKTTLDEPHWGTTTSKGLYYPVAWHRAQANSTSTNGATDHACDPTPTCVLQRQKPDGFNERDRANAGVHGDPDCSDMDSCYDWCGNHAGFHLDPKIMLALLIGLPLLFGIPLLALLLCLPLWLLRRHRNKRRANDPNYNEKERRPSVMEKLRRKSNGQPGTVVVNSATGQVVDPATGRPVEGGQGGSGTTTAIIAGSAAGAAAARSGSGSGSDQGNGGGQGGASGAGGAGSGGAASGAAGSGAAGGAAHPSAAGAGAASDGHPSNKVIAAGDDGKGTLGRQAEEGRSRVRFDEPPKDAAAHHGEGGAAPKAVPEGEPHVEAHPSAPSAPSASSTPAGPPKTDGTIESASGREWVDVGSMRGRKRARPEGQGLNLGF